MKPCPNCDSTERYKNGRCAPCTRASNQRWKSNNKDAHRAGSRRWEQEHPERCREHGRVKRLKNPSGAAARKKRWRSENPDKHVAHEQARRARKAASGGSYTAQEWRDLCARYGECCLRCGSRPASLTVDHVTPLSAGGRNDISNLQPLCGPCNSAKGTQATDYRTEYLGSQLIDALEAAA